MKTYKSVVDKPRLVITESWIQQDLHMFLEDNTGLKYVVYINDKDSLYNGEYEHNATKGRGLVFKIKVGYGGDIYFEKSGYPVWGHGHVDGRIRVYKDKSYELTEQQMFDDLKMFTDFHNTGVEYSFILYDENGVEEDSYGGGFYELSHIQENLPDLWKNEDMKDYVVKNT